MYTDRCIISCNVRAMEDPQKHPDAVSEVLAPEGDQTAPEGAARVAIPWSDYVDTSWDAFDFTPYEQFAEIDGRKVNYVDLGDEGKPVLLFVHGIMGTWRNWIFNLLPFADRYRVLAVDLPGFGLSEMPNGDFTLERYAETLKKLCVQLGIEKVTIIGNSMGGQVSAIVAKKFPELLSKLILVDAAGFSTSTKRLRKIAPYAKHFDWLFRFGYKIRKTIARSKLLTIAFTKIVLWRPAQISTELILVLLAGIGKKGFVPALQTIVNTPIKYFPGNIDTETVIIWGRNDSLIPKSDAFKYAKMIPQATLELMDDVGHIPMFETPDRFNALIEKYAPSTSGATSEQVSAAA
jgi:pimeloyl-ACP methyl ester carboxylesterase